MKITKRQLMKIIKEELTNINISEAPSYRTGYPGSEYDEWVTTAGPRSRTETIPLAATAVERPRVTDIEDPHGMKANIIDSVPIYWQTGRALQSALARVEVNTNDPKKGVATTHEIVTLNVAGRTVDHNQANVTHIEALDIWGVTEWS